VHLSFCCIGFTSSRFWFCLLALRCELH
jgi:hypothetical protein